MLGKGPHTVWNRCWPSGFDRAAVERSRELRSEDISDVARWLSWVKIKKTKENMREEISRLVEL